MELHTLGVDGGYTQKDVQEVARCFTGWTIFAPRGGAAATQSMLNGPRAELLRENAGKFFFNPRTHDDGEKIVLGHKIPAGGGIKDGLTVLDILAHSPATAKFVATKLVRHFVSDNPPPGLVDRVAATFTKTDGDIREMLERSSSRRSSIRGGLSSQDKAAFRVNHQCDQNVGRRNNRRPTIASMDRPHGRTALRVPDAQWLFRPGRKLGKYGWPAGAFQFWIDARKQSHSRNSHRPKTVCFQAGMVSG